jgi:hypothetical protein
MVTKDWDCDPCLAGSINNIGTGRHSYLHSIDGKRYI